MSNRVDSLTWMRPGFPWDSIRLAVLTVSPQRSYWNFVLPITPATTGSRRDAHPRWRG